MERRGLCGPIRPILSQISLYPDKSQGAIHNTLHLNRPVSELGKEHLLKHCTIKRKE